MHNLKTTVHALLVLALSLAWGTAARAITISLEGVVVESEPAGLTLGETGAGSLTYDGAFLTGIGEESVSPANGLLALDFTIFGQIFFDSSDIDFPDGYPDLTLMDGIPTYLDYVVEEAAVYNGDNPTDIVDPRVASFWFDSDLTETDPGVFSVGIGVTEVPEPSIALLLALGLAGLVGMRRREGSADS